MSPIAADIRQGKIVPRVNLVLHQTLSTSFPNILLLFLCLVLRILQELLFGDIFELLPEHYNVEKLDTFPPFLSGLHLFIILQFP